MDPKIAKALEMAGFFPLPGGGHQKAVVRDGIFIELDLDIEDDLGVAHVRMAVAPARQAIFTDEVIELTRRPLALIPKTADGLVAWADVLIGEYWPFILDVAAEQQMAAPATADAASERRAA